MREILEVLSLYHRTHENIPIMTVSELRDQGYDVIDIIGTDNQGMADELIL